MKHSFSLIILIIFLNSGFSQNTSLPDSSKTNQNLQEKTSNQYFNYDSDDIYAGRNEGDSLIYTDQSQNYDQYDEERKYERREYNEHVFRVFLNVGLLVLWIFSHYSY